MKKIVFIFSLLFLSTVDSQATDMETIKIIINPNSTPIGQECDDVIIIVYDANGNQVKITYTYDPLTNTFTINTNGLATGTYFIVIVDKKTGKVKRMTINHNNRLIINEKYSKILTPPTKTRNLVPSF